jgi:hypothetical protein
MKTFLEFLTKHKKSDRAAVMIAIVDVNAMERKLKNLNKSVSSKSKIKKMGQASHDKIAGELDVLQSKIDKAKKDIIKLRRR